MTYSYQNALDAYRAVGVEEGSVVFVTSDLGRLGEFESRRKADILDSHLRALESIIGPEGTLVVPTGCTNLCNTDVAFELEVTPSRQLGAFSEYVRIQPGTLRNFHPFISYSVRGKNAAYITQNTSRHAFGLETPMARMIELDTVCVSIGMEINMTATVAHHAEVMCSVPYRYTKEFLHPVKRGDVVNAEPFYLYVLYLDSDVTRDHQITLAKGFMETHKVSAHELGTGHVYAYSMQEYYGYSISRMLNDPYVWCKFPPRERPWKL